MAMKVNFVGKWVATLPYDTDDYLIEYAISLIGDSKQINATDLQDGEKMVISDITFDGTVLSFVSLMPSTGRKGINKFQIINDDLIESEFTFTVKEKLKRST